MILFQRIASYLRNDTICLPELKRTLFAHGYAVVDPYIVYKERRIARIEMHPDGIWLVTHSRKKGYSKLYKVKNMTIALHTLRRSYRHFLDAAERPGVRLPKIPITRPVRSNALAS